MGLREKMLATKERYRKVSAELPEGFEDAFGDETLYIREMTAVERDEYEGAQFVLTEKTHKFNAKGERARLLVRCLCDESGKRIFADDDVRAVSEMPSSLADKLYEQCRSINRMKRAELEKNDLEAAADSPSA